jgi:predicted ATP-grasp superfamily ATP-dependent carboligase
VAVVLGGSVNGLSFARSLGRRHVPVLMLDGNRFLGIYTRHAKAIRLPPIEECPGQWLDLLEFVGSQLPAPGVLFATSDASCLLVARHRDRLQRYFRFEVPDLKTLERIVNKRSQYEIARGAGIAIPETHFPESPEDVRHGAESVSYPCLLKPYRSTASLKYLNGRKVAVVTSASDLMSAYTGFAEAGVPVMVQAIIPGEDTELFGYLALWDRDGRELAAVTKRKLRQFPRHYGDGSLQITVDAPEVVALATRLLHALNFRGFGCVEFKFDARDRTFRLVECNPRTASGNQLAIRAGVDFPWLGYRYLTGIVPTDDRPHARPGIQHINEEWEIQAYLALRRSGEMGLLAWLRSIRNSTSWAVGAWDDPLPIIMGFGRFLKQRRSRSV